MELSASCDALSKPQLRQVVPKCDSVEETQQPHFLSAALFPKHLIDRWDHGSGGDPTARTSSD